jgi:lysylphosphatidylglycerol synthetase-like protein (DUF2156 family)
MRPIATLHELDGTRRSGTWRRRARCVIAAALVPTAIVVCLVSALLPSVGSAAVSPRAGGVERAQTATGGEGSSLESAAAKAGATGRAVAMSLIGLAFAVAATVLAFRRDFKEAAGVFAVGIVSVLLATPTGINLLRDTVGSLFGGQ